MGGPDACKGYNLNPIKSQTHRAMRQIRAVTADPPGERGPASFLEPPARAAASADMPRAAGLGERLVALSPSASRVPLPDALYEAIRAAQACRWKPAAASCRYVGKLMRKVNPRAHPGPAGDLAGKSTAEMAKMHRLERLREQLLEDEAETIGTIAETWPEADLQYLRTLRRNALKEREAARPRGVRFREIFRGAARVQEAERRRRRG